MPKLSFDNRKQTIETLKSDTFDLVIIGGGITGAGIAVQAAASGLKTALIEMQDFAEGTSSRSTKLVHGGIRYLKQFDVEVVADTVQERAVVQGIAPHVPKPAPMLMPIYDEPGASFNRFEIQIAMNLYDDLAGIKDGPYKNYMLSREEVIKRQPNLLRDNLIGGAVYLDYDNSDIKLVIENVKQAVSDGTLALSRAKVTGFEYNNAKISGVEVEDLVSNETFVIDTHIAINATGPWSDSIRKIDDGDHEPPQMRPTKGVHLVIERNKLPVDQPIYFDTGKQDGRMIFVIPRENKTYFGTTDTDYDGDFTHPTVTQADVDYLLSIVNYRFPDANITLQDIESSWAGLRPLISGNAASDYNGGNSGALSDKSFKELVAAFDDYSDNKVSRAYVEDVVNSAESSTSEKDASASKVSRGSDLSESDSGLFTLAGGKITDYRKMAEGALKAIIERLKARTDQTFELIDSKKYQVSGGHFAPDNLEGALEEFTTIAKESGFNDHDAEYLASWYGSNIEQVLTYLEPARQYSEKYQLKLSVALGLVYSLAEEGTMTASDFFARRTNYLLFRHDEVESVLQPVLDIIQDYLSLSDAQIKDQGDQLQAKIDEIGLKNLKNNHL